MSWNKGYSDAIKGYGPKNHANSPYQTREKYNAGYTAGKNSR